MPMIWRQPLFWFSVLSLASWYKPYMTFRCLQIKCKTYSSWPNSSLFVLMYAHKSLTSISFLDNLRTLSLDNVILSKVKLKIGACLLVSAGWGSKVDSTVGWDGSYRLWAFQASIPCIFRCEQAIGSVWDVQASSWAKWHRRSICNY